METKKTLVLGASTNTDRYSNLAIHQLLKHGHEVVAVGQKSGQVDSVTILDLPVEFDEVHTVTLYLNPSRQKQFYQYIIDLAPKRVIFNPGTENPEFYQLLDDAKIRYEVACTLVLLSTRQY